jgi:hypothetical protein
VIAMDKKLYQTLVEQFAMYNPNELQEVINDNESSNEAVKAAKYILSGESAEQKTYQTEIQKHESLLKERQDNAISNPLYDDLHQLTGDIRFIKNIIIIGIIFEFINIIASFLGI